MPTPLTPYETFLKQMERLDMNAADFARATGYSYNHAALLYRNDAPITIETIGRLLVVFGVSVAEPIANAMRAHGRGNGNGHKQ